MKFPSIRIDGNILSSDILDKIEQGEILYQLPKDFGFDPKTKVKDEIARAWADAQSQWKIYKNRIESLKETETGTSETRRIWIIPLLTFLGYELESTKSEIVNGKTYPISHRAQNLNGFPVHIMGNRDSLDKRRKESGPRMSPHSLVQEYINLTENLYAIVSNGLTLRLIRDSSRLVKLSFIEFDLSLMMEDELYSDFAVMYRLIHRSRMPASPEKGAESIIEQYHLDTLESGSRIREGLSKAVKESLQILGKGFLNDPANEQLRKLIESGELKDTKFHRSLLRVIYRILFLFVIEERGLVFSKDVSAKSKDIYYKYYSLSSLRKLCEKNYYTNLKFNNYWIQAKNTFKLFEDEQYGKPLEIKPLAGDLFEYNAIDILNECDLDNEIFMQCFRKLSIFRNEDTKSTIRINYAALNVEEFGSIYEGLLEFKPSITKLIGKWEYNLVKGSERSSSGSHYTPDELVKPLIKHSLDYIIEDKLKETDKEKALLSIKVCDVACGSGHILLNAARRIAFELAIIRENAEQPSPGPLRAAMRDVIKSCIYGVDKNELAVELCKIALWLESHNPGEPLSFLDHSIKCGDSIVGLAHKEELERGIATEAFKELPGDNKAIAAELRKQNNTEVKNRHQVSLQFKENIEGNIKDFSDKIGKISELPEHTPQDVKTKGEKYNEFKRNTDLWRLKVLADIQVAQFFLPKTNKRSFITDEKYFEYLNSGIMPQGEAVGAAMGSSAENNFFHWFLEFPEVFEKGGFDCILGNPPYLGGSKISTVIGNQYSSFLLYWNEDSKGMADLASHFFKKIFQIINANSFFSLIATSSISQGATRESSLGYLENFGNFNFALKSIKWPGVANINVSIVSFYKGNWKKFYILNNKRVSFINSFLEEGIDIGNPFTIVSNKENVYTGTKVYGEGFVLNEIEMDRLVKIDKINHDVISPYLTGDDIANSFHLEPSRFVINFMDWPFDKDEDINEAKRKKNKPKGPPYVSNYKDCLEILEMKVKPEREKLKSDETAKSKWWQFQRIRKELYEKISSNKQVLVLSQTAKYIAPTFVENIWIFSVKVIVFTFDTFKYFSIIQSHFHNEWVWKYSTTMGSSTVQYSTSLCYENFPLPQNSSVGINHLLDQIGEEYHEFRKGLMLNLQLGLTKTYNLFHTERLTIDNPQLKKANLQIPIEDALSDIYKLRKLHKQMDEAVLQAYGWTDIELKHDFYEVDYLPENDRIRYTIHPDSRKEILKRLLELNHKIHNEEVKAGLWDKKGKITKKTKVAKTKLIKPKERITPEQLRKFVLLYLAQKLDKINRVEAVKYSCILQICKNVAMNYHWAIQKHGPYDPEFEKTVNNLQSEGFLELGEAETQVPDQPIKPTFQSMNEVHDLEVKFSLSIEKQSIDVVIKDFKGFGARDMELRSTLIFLHKTNQTWKFDDVVTELTRIKPHFRVKQQIEDVLIELMQKGYVDTNLN